MDVVCFIYYCLKGNILSVSLEALILNNYYPLVNPFLISNDLFVNYYFKLEE